MDRIKLAIPCEIVKADLLAATCFITGDESQSKYLRIGLELLAGYAQPDGNDTIFPGLVREVVVAHLLESARRVQKSNRWGADARAHPLWKMAREIRDGVDVTPPDPMGFACAIGPCCHCDPLTRGRCDA